MASLFVAKGATDGASYFFHFEAVVVVCPFLKCDQIQDVQKLELLFQ